MQIQKDSKRIRIHKEAVKCLDNDILMIPRRLSKTKKHLVLMLTVVATLLLLCFSIFTFDMAFDGYILGGTHTFFSDSDSFNFGFLVSPTEKKVDVTVFNRGAEPFKISVKTDDLGNILSQNNIFLDDTCVLNYSLDDDVFDGMVIKIDSVTYDEITVSSSIPFDEKVVEKYTIPKGQRNVTTYGTEGLLSSVYKRKFVNGEIESSELVSQNTLVEPKSQVVEVGIGGKFKGSDGIFYNFSHYIDVIATVYGPSDGTSGNITATGTVAREGVMAVDPSVIPLGTKAYVAGDYKVLGVLSAEDTGSYITGNRIDIYMLGTLQELLEFGRRSMRVYILE